MPATVDTMTSSLDTSSLLPPGASNLPLSCSVSENADVIRTIMKQESKIYFKSNQLCNIEKDPWRRIMINWMCIVVDVFDLPNLIVCVATYYLDRSVEHNLIRSPEDYKLASLTSLNLAIKVHDYKLFPLNHLLQYSRTTISVDDVSQMEQRIIKALNWMLHPPTYDCFFHQYCVILDKCATSLPKSTYINIKYNVRELLGVAVYLESLRRFRPSVITYAAMLVILDKLLQDSEITKKFIDEMKQVTNLTHRSKGFAEAVAELATYLADNCELVASSRQKQTKNKNPAVKTTSPSAANGAHELHPCHVSNQEVSSGQKSPFVGQKSPCFVVDEV